MADYHRAVLHNFLFFASWLVPLAVSIVVMLVGFIRWRSPSSWRLRFWGGFAAVIIFAAFILFSSSNDHSWRPIPVVPPWHMTRDNLSTIQIAVERYADHNDGHYPLTIEDLFTEPILNSTPRNRYTGKLMVEIPFGATPWEGEFTYVPVKQGEDVIGYYLIAYGGKDWRGDDIDGDGQPDHVLQVLSSKDAHPETLLPPLEELLRASKASSRSKPQGNGS